MVSNVAGNVFEIKVNKIQPKKTKSIRIKISSIMSSTTKNITINNDYYNNLITNEFNFPFSTPIIKNFSFNAIVKNDLFNNQDNNDVNLSKKYKPNINGFEFIDLLQLSSNKYKCTVNRKNYSLESNLKIGKFLTNFFLIIHLFFYFFFF